MYFVRIIAATIVGLLLGGTCVALIQLVNSFLYPVPPEVDLNQPDQLAKWARSLPTPAFLIVLASWAAGPFVGTAVSRVMSPNRSIPAALIVWILFSAATISMLSTIPHPWWMWPAGIIVVLLSGSLGILATAPVNAPK